MMTGIYIEEINQFPPSIASVPTAIPAFIGYTAKALDKNNEVLTNIPTKISSLGEYECFFGSAENEKFNVEISVNSFGNSSNGSEATIITPSPNNMYFSLKSFFNNGGNSCYIVSVGETGSPLNAVDLQSGLKALETIDETTLIIFPEGQSMNEAEYISLIDKAIQQCAKHRDRFTLVDIHSQKETTELTISNFRKKLLTENNLSYAAAYYPNLITNYNYQYNESEVNVIITTDEFQASPVKLITLKNTNPTIYTTAKTAIQKLTPILPPSPAIAGIYTTIDKHRGVWKAPANIPLSGILNVTKSITSAEQENMNIDAESGKSVNAIRVFAGKGIMVWGARTLAGNDNEWRYIPVRRFLNMVEESVNKSTCWVVFEPNDANTWTKVRAMIENYLTTLWRNGALSGATPEQAFYVKCGLGETMTDEDIFNGYLNVEIGMAIVRPAEFIILRFSHRMYSE